MKPKTINLTIGRMTIGFILQNVNMLRQIQKRYSGYIQSETPYITFICTFSTRACFSLSEKVTVEQKSAQQWQVRRRDFSGEWQGNHGYIRMQPSIYSFDACLRVIISINMAHYRSLLLHSAGIILNQKAFLFLGSSGSGKTTISQIARSQQGNVVNDEICALVSTPDNNGGSFTIFGTPFWGEMGRGPVFSQGFPLQGVYFLKKDLVSKQQPLAKEDAISRFLRCACIYEDSKFHHQLLLDFAIEIMNQTPRFMFHFTKRVSLSDILGEPRMVHP